MKFKINYLTGFVLVFAVNFSFAQTISLYNTPDGIYVSVDKTTPNKVRGYIVEKEGSQTSEFNKLLELQTPNSREEMVSKLEKAVDLLSFTKHQLNHDAIWDSLQSNTLNPNNYMLNLPPVKLAVGTGYIDRNVKENESYSYVLKDNGGKLIAKAGPFKYNKDPEFPEITLFEVSENITKPIVKWYTLDPGNIRDFEIYRAPYGSTAFDPVQTMHQTIYRSDTLWLTMIDTTLETEGLNLYFIIPKDFYGNKGTSGIAVQVSNLSNQSLPVFTKLEAVGHPSAKAILIKWKISRAERTRSLQLYRSSTYYGDYYMVAELSTADSMYVDPVPIANENYYYYLQINDVFGVSRKSAKFFGLFKGTIIPLPPKMLKAEPVEGGISIQWEPKDESVKGFYVLRGEGYKGEMTQISPFLPKSEDAQVYVDSSSTLKGQLVYSYAVLAESDTYDKSAPSDTLYSRPGIKTSISAPTDFDVFIRDRGVRLIWRDHSKFEPYLSGYKIWRKTIDDDQYTLLTDSIVPNTLNMYFDSTIIFESKYQYAVSAVDHFGAESYKTTSRIVDLNGILYKMPEDFWIEKIDKGVRLKWVMPEVENLTGFNLYRSDEKEAFTLWKNLSPESRDISDAEFQKGQTKFYRISAVYNGTIESEKTHPLMIRL